MDGTAQDQASGLYPGLRKGFNTARDATAKWVLENAGKGQTLPEHEVSFHREGSRRLTDLLGQALPPELAATLADVPYLANEAITGAMAAGLTDEDFFSKYGFDWADVSLNRQGQDEAIQDLRTENAMYPNVSVGPVPTYVPLGVRKWAAGLSGE